MRAPTVAQPSVSTATVRRRSRASSSRQSALSSSGARAAPATRSRVSISSRYPDPNGVCSVKSQLPCRTATCICIVSPCHSARPANQHAIERRWAAWSRKGNGVRCGMCRSDGPSHCPGHRPSCQAGSPCPRAIGPAHPCDRTAAHTAAAPRPGSACASPAAVRPGANGSPPDSAFATPSPARSFGIRWHGVLGELGQGLERAAGPPRPVLAPLSRFGQNSLMKQSET